MRHWRTILLWGGLMLALAVVNRGIVQRERILDEGRTVLLELAPIDPRSLMQGDYMALRFAVADDIRDTLHPPVSGGGNAAALANLQFGTNGCENKGCHDGYVVVAPDRDSVGRFRRLQDAPTPVHAGELAVRYREREWGEIRIASNAWFFAEGRAERFEPARYGELRVAADGTVLLVALRDAQRKPL